MEVQMSVSFDRCEKEREQENMTGLLHYRSAEGVYKTQEMFISLMRHYQTPPGQRETGRDQPSGQIFLIPTRFQELTLWESGSRILYLHNRLATFPNRLTIFHCFADDLQWWEEALRKHEKEHGKQFYALSKRPN